MEPAERKRVGKSPTSRVVSIASSQEAFALLLAYVQEHGNARVPVEYKTADGAALGTWVNRQRTVYKKGAMSEARVLRLEAVAGWMWAVSVRNL